MRRSILRCRKDYTSTEQDEADDGEEHRVWAAVSEDEMSQPARPDISYHYDSQPKLEVGDFFFQVIKFRHAAPERWLIALSGYLKAVRGALNDRAF